MRVNFDKLEASAARGNLKAASALEWISDSIAAAFKLNETAKQRIPLDGADACERVAEALAVWFKESAPAGFEIACGADYRVELLETCAAGFERLRNRNQFILLAYPGRDSTPAEIAEQWDSDIDSCSRPDGFAYHAAAKAVADWAEANESTLAAELAALEWPADPDAEDSPDFESPAFRLYVADYSESAE